MRSDLLGWPIRSIDELCQRVTSGGTPKRTTSEYYGGGIPWVKTGELRDTDIFTADESLTGIGLRESSAKLLPVGTILMAMYGATVGALGRLAVEATCNQASCALITDAEITDSRWLFYLLLNDRVRIVGRATGAAQQNLSAATIKKFEYLVPPLAEQRAIAEVLGALDDKIAANTRLAATAESYLRAEVDTRWLKRPERDSVLSNYVELNPKLKLKADVAEPIYIDMKRLPESGWTIQGSDNRPAKGGARFANGDTLLARITPCLQNRKTGYVDDLEEGAVGIGSTEFIVMRSVEGIASPISFLLATESRFREFSIQQMIGTSGRQRVAANALSGFELPTPDRTWLNEFGTRAESLFAHVRSLNRENRTLAETRDALLPKLMSGQLRVRDAERIAEAVGT